MKLIKYFFAVSVLCIIFSMGNYIHAADPTVGIDGPYSNLEVNTTYSYTANAKDSDGYIEKYKWSNGKTGSSTTYKFSKPGSYSIYVIVTDNDGNTKLSQIFVSVIDSSQNQSPVARITGPSSGTESQTLNFSASSSSDPDGTIEKYFFYTSNGEPAQFSSSYSYSCSFSNPGVYYVYVRVYDNENETDKRSIKVTIENSNKSPVSKISGGSTVYVGRRLSLSGDNSYDSDGQISSYHWTGSNASFTSTNNACTRVTFNAIGTYTVYLKVYDNKGAYSVSSKTITAKEYNVPTNKVPKAIITSPDNAIVGEQIMISGENSYDVDGNINTFSWQATTASPNQSNSSSQLFVFNDEGLHNIKLTVYDNDGSSAMATKTINVKIDENKAIPKIISLDSVFTETDVSFNARDINGEFEKCEWKWQDDSTNVISTDREYIKKWKYNESGLYTIYLRIFKDGIWSEWVSKSIQVKEGITFKKDDKYTNRTLKSSEIEFLDEIWGINNKITIDSGVYYLNIDIFWDKGLIVYGDYTLDNITENDFSEGSEGKPYFEKQGSLGEYRYLGFGISGALFSNQNYISSYYLNLSQNNNAIPIEFERLPYDIKMDFNIQDLDNSIFSVLSEIVNKKTNHFTNNNATNNPNPLRLEYIFNRFNIPYSPFSYGLINSLDKNIGGSIRMFFEYTNGGYDYRTFEGELTSDLQIPNVYIEDDLKEVYTLGILDKSITINAKIKLRVNDNHNRHINDNTLSFYYTRDDNYMSYLDVSDPLNLISSIQKSEYEEENDMYIVKDIQLNFERDDLKEGYNVIEFDVSGGIQFTNNVMREEKNIISFVINKKEGQLSKVETKTAKIIDSNTLDVGCIVTNKGIPSATEAGVQIIDETNSYVCIENDNVEEGEYIKRVTGLQSGKTYQYRAYILQNGKYIYGNTYSITLPSKDYVQTQINTKDATNITNNTAKLGVDVIKRGNPIAKDIYLVLNNKNSLIYEGEIEIGDKNHVVLNLLANTEYTFDFYTIQKGSKIYGGSKRFVTDKSERNPPRAPEVTDIEQTKAVITSDSGSYVVCNNRTKPSGSVFYGLDANTEYSTYAYYPENEQYKRSQNSEVVNFKTLDYVFSLVPTAPHTYNFRRIYRINSKDGNTRYEGIEIIDKNKAIKIDRFEVIALSGTGEYRIKAIKDGNEKIYTIKLRKGHKNAPVAPIVSNITKNSAIISSNEGSLVVCNGQVKKSGSKFNNLKSDYEYETWAYFEDDENYYRSVNSDITKFRTNKSYEYELYIQKIYDPDFDEHSMIPVYNRPILESYGSGYINLGYRVDFICYFQAESPDFNKLIFYDYNGKKVYPYTKKNGRLCKANISITEYNECEGYAEFSVYIDPHTVFYYENNETDILKRTEIDEVLVCLKDNIAKFLKKEFNYNYIWKEIDVNEVPLFWYNLQENSFSEID